MNNSKQAISPVIASILLLAITVVISMSIYSYLEDYVSSTSELVSNDGVFLETQLSALFGEVLFLKSESSINLTVLKVLDSNKNEICTFSEENSLDTGELVIHYLFDELNFNGSHYILEDQSGNLHNGVLFDSNHSNDDGNSVAQLVNSANGNALLFDGVDDYVDLGSLNVLENLENISFVLLIKPLRTPSILHENDGIFSAFDDWDNQFSIRFGGRENSLTGYVENNSYAVRSHFLNMNNYREEYFLYTYEFSNGSNEFSINGEHFSQEEENLIYSINNSLLTYRTPIISNNMYLGRLNDIYNLGSTNNYYKGELDELLIFNRTLTTDEINELYWNLIKNQQSGVSQIDLRSCDLNKNSKYTILLIDSSGKKIQKDLINR